LAHNEPRRPSDGSSRFYPPDCYQLSQAGTSSLLRIHLPPRTASKGLEFPLVPSLPDPSTKWIETIRGFPSYLWLPVSYRILNHVTGYDQVSGFALCCTLTHPLRRIRFACAMCSLLPIASFRPCRCQQRPCDSDCLPPDQGDVCILQQAGFASSAGQTTRKRPRVSWGVLRSSISASVPFVGTFDGSRDLSNPNIFVFKLYEISSKRSGGSETSIQSSSLFLIDLLCY